MTQARETRLATLKADLEAARNQRPPAAADMAKVRAELMMLAGDWRRVLSKTRGTHDRSSPRC